MCCWHLSHGGTRWRSWLRLQIRRLRVRLPMASLESFSDIMAAGSTQPLTEMSTRNISWGVKAAGAYSWQPYHLHVPIVLKSGSLNLLEPSGPVQACNGTAFTPTLTVAKKASEIVALLNIWSGRNKSELHSRSSGNYVKCVCFLLSVQICVPEYLLEIQDCL